MPAKYMLLSSTNKATKAVKENQNIDYHQCLREIKETIEAAHVYFPVCSLEWWSYFFEEQEQLIQGIGSRTNEVLNLDPFFWRVCQATLAEENNLENRDQSIQLSEELERLVYGETREAYIGAKKTSQRRQYEKEMWEGNVDELTVGTMIAVLAMDDESGCPFWIAKIIKIHEQNLSIDSIDVHSYKAIGEDAITRKYYPKMIKVSKKGKKFWGQSMTYG